MPSTIIVIIELSKESSTRPDVKSSSFAAGLVSSSADISRVAMSETESLREKFESTLVGDGVKAIFEAAEF